MTTPAKSGGLSGLAGILARVNQQQRRSEAVDEKPLKRQRQDSTGRSGGEVQPSNLAETKTKLTEPEAGLNGNNQAINESRKQELDSKGRVENCFGLGRPEIVARNVELDNVKFWNGVKFSPDGLCLLSAGNDNALRIYERETIAMNSTPSPILSYQEGDSIFDYAWYPGMDSNVPGSCCFLSSARSQPIHLWDAYYGHLRASYKCVNALDELSTALSLEFNMTGQRIYAGVERGVYVFDVNRPGPQVQHFATSPTRKSPFGQRGILSCFAPHPTEPGKLVVGSYDGTFALYDESDMTQSLKQIPGHSGGLTQVKFTRCGTRLLTAGRRGGHIRMWDLRKLDDPIGWFPRDAHTNQRIYFDLDATDQYLVTGSCQGQAMVYRLDAMVTNEKQPLPLPLWTSENYSMVVNGVSFSPQGRSVALAIGDRQVLQGSPPESSDSDDNDDIGDRSNNESGVKVNHPRIKPPRGSLALVDFVS